MNIQWIDGGKVGYAGSKARLTIYESHPPGISWKITAEALGQIPGGTGLYLTGRKLSEGAPTLDAAKALAVLLVGRLLADSEVAA